MPKYYSALHKLLDDHGIYTIRQLCALTGLSAQQGWNLWHGKVGVGRKTANLLHEKCRIPYEALMQLPSVPSVPRPEPKARLKYRPRGHEEE
jgi:transcriptional regulator with XRE-family HTH domain